MNGTRSRPYLAEPRLAALPWLIHGFGNADWTEEAARAAPGFEGFAWAVLDQVHGDAVHRLEGAPAGRLRGDGLVTAAPRLLLVVRTADCLPVLLADERRRVVAAVHCGRRGTVRRILARTVETMVRDYGSDPRRIRAALGPCIGPGCYEVGEEVRDEFLGGDFPAEIIPPRPGSPGKFLLDLPRANALALASSGVPPENITTLDHCTHCGTDVPLPVDESGTLVRGTRAMRARPFGSGRVSVPRTVRFFSYRRDPGEAGRMVNFIGLR